MSDEDGTKLTRPNGGCWMDPAFAQSLPTSASREQAWELYSKAADCPPGAGLAGTMAEECGFHNRHVHWRQIKGVLDDPFKQAEPHQRARRTLELGLGLVAAVPFSFVHDRGIVLYYSRSTANLEGLRSESNARCLMGSTDLIGATYAIKRARKESTELRKKKFHKSIRTVRRELLHGSHSLLALLVANTEHMEKLRLEKEREAALSVLANADGWGLKGGRVDQLAHTIAEKAFSFGQTVLKRIRVSRKKWGGAKLNGPPRQSFSDCIFAFTGVFITMLAILHIARHDSFDFEPGWYTSTLCIVFALTPAPVGQPRQIFSAHLWNMLVGLACRQIPTNWGLSLLWVQALAVALGISGQAFIGILHPPATGLSMVFASDSQWTWSTIASVMMADSVVVVVSMLFLNLSEKEQYPMYWLGLGSGGTMGYVRSKSRSLRRSVSTARNSASVSLENIRAMISTDRVEQSHDILRRRPCDGDQCNVSYGSFNIPVWHSMEFDES